MSDFNEQFIKVGKTDDEICEFITEKMTEVFSIMGEFGRDFVKFHEQFVQLAVKYDKMTKILKEITEYESKIDD